MRRLITNALIIDGTGAPAYQGELLFEDGVIAEVGEVQGRADETLDVEGMVVAPGFIDIHSHSDFALPADPLAAAKICQGVTTEVVGNCGLGLCPANDRVEQLYATFSPLFFGETTSGTSKTLAEYRDRLHAEGISQNVAMLIPHGNLRCAVMGMQERESTLHEQEQMHELLDHGMRQGAFGLSTGLVYPPGAYANTEEIIALAKTAARHGGIYATHMRDEGSRVVDSVREAIRVGEEADISVQISHHKAAGRPNWGKVKETLKLVEEARARGVDVNSDVYPYTAGSTVLSAMFLPMWAFEGSHAELMGRLRNPSVRERIVSDSMARFERFFELPSWLSLIPKRLVLPIILRMLSDVVVVSSVKHQHHLEGKSLRQLSKERRRALFDTILDLLLEEEAAVVAIAHVMSEADVRRVLQHPTTMVGSDGFPMMTGKPHPRTYGTFPRVLSKYVKADGLLSLEEAVHRMTGLTAQKLGLRDRGILAPGYAADVVVFDAHTVDDQATYEEPRQPPRGLPHVFVGGAWTVRDGAHTGARAGRVLHHQH